MSREKDTPKKPEEEMEDESSSEESEEEEIKPTSTLQNFIKPGKVVIMLQGRRAGTKAVILQNYDNPDKKKYNHSYAYVCGISKFPKPIRRKMSKRKIERRTRFRCYMKRVAYTHFMPTRYGFDISDLPQMDSIASVMKDPTRKRKTSAQMHSTLKKKYLTGKNQWFFTKLRF